MNNASDKLQYLVHNIMRRCAPIVPCALPTPLARNEVAHNWPKTDFEDFDPDFMTMKTMSLD